MNKGKYIVYEDGDCEVFDMKLQHRNMAKYHGGKPVSAGFFYEDNNGEPYATGMSMTLNLGHQTGDTAKITKALSELS